MDIKAEKLVLIKEIEQINDQSILQILKKIIDNYTHKAEGRISLEQYNSEIEEAMRRVEAGEFYTHEEVKDMMKQW